jgi:BioD-like phosphotransacetylase family protein
MSSAGLASLGVIPEDRRLLSLTVSQIAAELHGRYVLFEELGDRLVEHFMVGGMSLDSGEPYFRLRENKAVIIRGDRPDIQMAALQTPTACMLLTNGIEPIEYVAYEAEQERVPVIVVEPDTLSTMDALGTVSSRASFDHPSKLERFGELLEEHVDLAAIYAGLGLAA